jgi:hypothetical protein
MTTSYRVKEVLVLLTSLSESPSPLSFDRLRMSGEGEDKKRGFTPLERPLTYYSCLDRPACKDYNLPSYETVR